MGKNSYMVILIILILLSIGFSFFFKYYTDSLLGITKKTKREIEQYESRKRQQEITIKSLLNSCVDYNKLYIEIMQDLKNSKHLCSQEFLTKINHLPLDSSLYHIFYQIHEDFDYKEIEIINEKKYQYIYHKKDVKGEKKLTMIFKKNDENDYLISDLIGVGDFFSFSCKEDNK